MRAGIYRHVWLTVVDAVGALSTRPLVQIGSFYAPGLCHCDFATVRGEQSVTKGRAFVSTGAHPSVGRLDQHAASQRQQHRQVPPHHPSNPACAVQAAGNPTPAILGG
jgi:hypothetical protein